MTRQGASPEAAKQKRSEPGEERVGWLGPVTAGVATCVLVLRMCMAPESSALGETLWLTLLGLIAGVLPLWGWMCGKLPQPRWGKIDLWVGLLCGGHLLSGLFVILGEGDKRGALNLMFEWSGVLTVWVLLRTVCLQREGRGVVLRGLLAMLIAQAGLGIWQHHYGYARMSQGYLELRKELDRLEGISTPSRDVMQNIQRTRQKLIQSGVQEHMLEGTGRIAFEARLLQSSEALGRCSLANTLAGLLLIGWVWLGGSLISTILSKRSGVAFVVEFLCWCSIGYALLLTKSRTAYAGGITAAGLLICFTVFSAVRTMRGRLSVLVVMIVLTAGVGIGGYLTGGIDRLVWEEAPKSLKYRMEYWQGAMGVIGEAPVFGTGPGQFRQHYLKYKLPESSEEIVDPHNMLLDVWSNGGVIGLVGLIGILGWVLRRGVKLGLGRIESSGDERGGGGIDPVWNQMGWILGVVGMLTIYVINGGGDQELLVVGGVWLGLMLAGGIWLRGDNSERSAEWGIIALVGIGVHLLGNGGVGMPTVLIAFLSLLAMTVPTVAQEGAPERRRLWMLIGWPVGWGTACLVFGALPVTNSSDLKESAKFARTPESRLGLLRQGAEADRIAPDGWGDLSVALTEEWLRQPKQRVAVYEQALAAAEEAVRRDPYNGVRYRQVASLMWYRARVEKDPSFAVAAGENFEKAIERSPTRVDLIADAAAAMELAGKGERSRELARKGLELDELNHQAGHSDKFLPEKQVEELKKIVGGGDEPEPPSEK